MIKLTILLIASLLVLFTLLTGYRIARLQLSIASYKNYWIKQAATTSSQDAFTYVVLGDSAAQGIGASTPLKGYVGIVADYIRQQTGRQVHVINISVSGARLQDVLDKQIPALQRIPAYDLVTIDVGANDIPNFHEQEFMRMFSALVSAMPKDSIIADIPSFAGGRRRTLDPTAQQAAEIAASRIAQREDVYLAPLYQKTKMQGFTDFAADFFHPNDQGYQLWAAAFIEALAQTHLQ